MRNKTIAITIAKEEYDYDSFLNPMFWPDKALVKRYFLPRAPRTEQKFDMDLTMVENSSGNKSNTNGHADHENVTIRRRGSNERVNPTFNFPNNDA